MSPKSCHPAFSIIAIFRFNLEKDVRGEDAVWREKGLPVGILEGHPELLVLDTSSPFEFWFIYSCVSSVRFVVLAVLELVSRLGFQRAGNLLYQTWCQMAELSQKQPPILIASIRYCAKSVFMGFEDKYSQEL